MFDNEDWNVDHVAKSLDSSLFGPVTPTRHNNKKSKSKLFELSQNQESLARTGAKRKLSCNQDTNESITQKKKKKKRKKKQLTFTDEVGTNSNVQVFRESSEEATVAKENGSQAVKKNKKKPKRKNVSAVVKDHLPEKESSKVCLLEGNNDENVSLILGDKKKVKQNQKRKRNNDLNGESSSPKKSKGDNCQKTNNTEDGQMTRKERRNKRRKRNSKKNKYKHLAVASHKEKETSQKNFNVLSTALTSESSKNDIVEEKDRLNDKELESLNKKKHKTWRKQDSQCDTAGIIKSSGEGSAQITKHISEMINNKSKMKSLHKKKQKEKLLVNSQYKVDTTKTSKKEKGIKKQSFDVSKLKEIMSSEEIRMKTLMDEENKKSAKRLSEKSIERVEPQSDNVKASGKIGRLKSPTNQSKQQKHIDSANEWEDMDSPSDHSRTSNKQSFNVKQLKETASEKKQTKVHEKKENEGHVKSLKEKMQDRLNAARFRYLNEQLYTTTGDEAAALFADDNDAFHVYHQGYESQVSKWPVDPLTVIIRQIRARHKSTNTVIADMGCGSARLAQQLTGVKVHSFDFVAVNKLVTACNMSDVPLDDGSVDVVVFCLSLMGTNLVDYLLEANRILKTGGTMKIAEVESRFKKVGAFVSKVEKLGFELVTKDLSNKMFYMFDFKKDKNAKGSPYSPKIELDPCIYKKR